MKAPLLNIENLTVSFDTDEGRLLAVDKISLKIQPGGVVGLVGESGCGKSATALSIMRLIPNPPGQIESGAIHFEGHDLLKLPQEEMQALRGNHISMIFQEPLSALSPLKPVGRQLVEGLRLHRDIPKKEAHQIALEWLEKVRIQNPHQKIEAYPYELSGGMQQRVMIAMAMMLSPKLLIADEPTTALDVTVQAQINDLVLEMRKHSGASVLLITHDMAVVWEMCDQVVVMYASEVVESGSAQDIFSKPSHPYTQGLLKSIPTLKNLTQKLGTIPGQVPSPLNYPKGCRFADRCAFVFDRCRNEKPSLVETGENHHAACFLASGGDGHA